MAFNFNSINQALGQTNIFDPENMENGVPAQTNVFSGTAGAPPPAASPSGGVQSQNPSARAVQAYNPNQASAAYAGVKATDSSKATGTIQSNIQQASQKLQDKANEFAAGTEAAKAGNALSSETVDKAIQGNAEAEKATRDRLAQTLPKQREAFVGLKDEELPSSANNLQSPNNWGEIFRQQAGPNYSWGQSNLEDMLLGRDSQFRNLAATLGQQQSDVISKNDDLVANETKRAQDILNADFNSQTGLIRGQLEGAAKSLKNDAISQERLQELDRSKLNPQQIINDELAKLRPDLAEYLSDQGYAGWENQLWQAGQDPRLQNYLTINKDLNWQQMMGEDQVGQFNRINALLGNSESPLTAGTASPAYNFDKGGAVDLISQIIMGKANEARKADDARNAQIALESKQASEDAALKRVAQSAKDEQARLREILKIQAQKERDEFKKVAL